jgi:hypothetical protein
MMHNPVRMSLSDAAELTTRPTHRQRYGHPTLRLLLRSVRSGVSALRPCASEQTRSQIASKPDADGVSKQLAVTDSIPPPISRAQWSNRILGLGIHNTESKWFVPCLIPFCDTFRLWHQLTVKLLSFIGHESLADGLIDLHANLIKDLADRMSPMWVPIRSNRFYLLFVGVFVRCFLLRLLFAIVIAASRV